LTLGALPLQTALPSPHGEPAAALDIIFIEGFSGDTVIGIHDGEQHPQPLVVDVHAGLARAGACETDFIGDTIDYSVVRERLRELFATHRIKLLEAFAEAIATMLIQDFGAAWVRVKVVKPRKFNDVQAMGVVIERRAPPPSATLRGAAVLQLIGAGMVPGK